MELTTLLNKSQNQLGNIIAKVRLLRSLQTLLEKNVDAELAANLQVANYRQGCLVVQFSNPALATHFRYQIPHLLQQLRLEQQLPGLASIKCQVRPEKFELESLESLETSRKNITLSKNSSEVIKQTAKFISDPSLATALQKLGSRTKETCAQDPKDKS